jgi:hypothetical protein
MMPLTEKVDGGVVNQRDCLGGKILFLAFPNRFLQPLFQMSSFLTLKASVGECISHQTLEENNHAFDTHFPAPPEFLGFDLFSKNCLR